MRMISSSPGPRVRRMMRAVGGLGLVGLLALSPVPTSSAAIAAAPLPPPELTALQPGGVRELSQSLPVNVVFVGLEPGAGPRRIDEGAFRSALPAGSRPVAIAPSQYAGMPVPVGLRFVYDYHIVYADQAFEDAFFAFLAGAAIPGFPSAAQDQYNAQRARSLDFGENHWITAPVVERWLAANVGPRLGVDTRRDTVFFLNWYGRPDFQFHVYVKTDEPDPDTGLNYGALYNWTDLLGWGGTAPDDPQGGSVGP